MYHDHALKKVIFKSWVRIPYMKLAYIEFVETSGKEPV